MIFQFLHYLLKMPKYLFLLQSAEVAIRAAKVFRVFLEL